MERQELERHIHEMARQDVINQGHKADHIIVVGGEGWRNLGLSVSLPLV